MYRLVSVTNSMLRKSRHVVIGTIYNSFLIFSEAYIAMAVLRLIEEEKCVVEGAGATGLAAALAGLLPELKGKR